MFFCYFLPGFLNFYKVLKCNFFSFIFSINFATSAQLLSHKATYTLKIQNIKDNSFIIGGQGQTFFEIIENCNGWNIKDDYVLIYELPNEKIAKNFIFMDQAAIILLILFILILLLLI